MFTGIISAVGTIAELARDSGEVRLRIATGKLDLDGLAAGDSVAVNGVCLTATEIHDDGFTADVSRETCGLTTLGSCTFGDGVNLERALAAGDALGGHLVTGHVDGTGTVQAFTPDGSGVRLTVNFPAELGRFIARKGSVCVDGVSLTVNSVSDDAFEVMIVPHTLDETVISGYQAGTRVNLEVDLVARYLERIVQYTG